MPLVWAHAEYVKLLRSVTDGRVFDRISAVAERYCRGKRPPPVEIFRIERQLQNIVAGRTLRVLADDQFGLVWTTDDWQTSNRRESRNVGAAGYFVDAETEPGKAGRIIFTLQWRQDNRWEGRNFEVRLDPVDEQMAVEETSVAHATS
jgi:glucoamylase